MDHLAFRDFKSSIALDRDGNWWHEGVIFSNEKLSALFLRSIEWSETKNKFVLRIEHDEADFEYDVTPLIAKDLVDNADSAGRSLLFILNTGHTAACQNRSCFYLSSSRLDCFVKAEVHLRQQWVRVSRTHFQTLSAYITDQELIAMNGCLFPVKTIASVEELP